MLERAERLVVLKIPYDTSAIISGACEYVCHLWVPSKGVHSRVVKLPAGVGSVAHTPTPHYIEAMFPMHQRRSYIIVYKSSVCHVSKRNYRSFVANRDYFKRVAHRNKVTDKPRHRH